MHSLSALVFSYKRARNQNNQGPLNLSNTNDTLLLAVFSHVYHTSFLFFFYTVTKLTIHNYKQEQKQDMHIIMTLAQHVLEYITQIQLFNTPTQFQVILVNNLTVKKSTLQTQFFLFACCSILEILFKSYKHFIKFIPLFQKNIIILFKSGNIFLFKVYFV